MCGSDLKFYRAAGGASSLGLGKLSGPVIAGHEPCGVVVAVGAGVEREAGARRHARDAAPLSRLRRVRALLHRLDAVVRGRRRRSLWRHRQRRACQVHEMPRAHAGAAARRALVRDRRCDLVRHRHCMGRPASARPAGRSHHRDLRAGSGRPVGDAARACDGCAGDRARYQRGAARARARSSVPTR